MGDIRGIPVAGKKGFYPRTSHVEVTRQFGGFCREEAPEVWPGDLVQHFSGRVIDASVLSIAVQCLPRDDELRWIGEVGARPDDRVRAGRQVDVGNLGGIEAAVRKKIPED